MQPLTYVLKTLEKQVVNGSPVVTLQCVSRSGPENVAEICTPSPDTNLRFANLRFGNPRFPLGMALHTGQPEIITF